MAHWYPLEPVDESFFTHAPHVYRIPVELPVSPERVWESLVAPGSVAAWTPLLASIEWTSPRPFGVGTQRTVSLPARGLVGHEHFFRWEEGRQHSFYMLEANRPLLRRFAEDYLVEATDTGSRLTWTFALEGTAATRLLMNALSPANRVLFGRMAHGAQGYFAQHPQAD